MKKNISEIFKNIYILVKHFRKFYMEVPIPLLGLPLAEVPQGKLLDKDDILRLLYGKFGGTLAAFKGFGKITCSMRRGSREARCSTPGGCTLDEPCFLFKVPFLTLIVCFINIF
jgi:hypothetical protein